MKKFQLEKSSKATCRKRTSKTVLNHYSAWKYLVIIATLLVLGFSAIPSWYGEQPSIKMTVHQIRAPFDSVDSVNELLQEQGVSAEKITQSGATFELLFAEENSQKQAKEALAKRLTDQDSISFSYQSVAPDWFSSMGLHPIKLGLDLRGGVQFLLDVDIDKAFDELQIALADDVKNWVREQRLRGVQVRTLAAKLVITGPELGGVKAYIEQNNSQWKTKRNGNQLIVFPDPDYVSQFRTQTLQENLTIMRDRIEELGITEAKVQRQGDSSIRIELPGVQDPAQAKNVIGATSSLAFYQVVQSGTSAGDTFRLTDVSGTGYTMVKRPVLTGEHIIDARVGRDKMGMALVNIKLDHAGGKVMSAYSGHHIGEPMATVYKEYKTNGAGETVKTQRVISVATIQSQLGSQFDITGTGSIEQAQELALLLRAGSLTAPVSIVEERTIGASLGAENIEKGFAALALGLGLTLTFMALWYRRLGWVANGALLINMVCLLGLIALLPGAVLTLPGIAGLVLTVGMAVDTNVLIFERIKDNLAEGRCFSQAIDRGFSSALSTILDANITTMITAVILYSMGNGPIQGFALTLGLGLMTSMFSGVFASRAIINVIWGRDSRRSVRV